MYRKIEKTSLLLADWLIRRRFFIVAVFVFCIIVSGMLCTKARVDPGLETGSALLPGLSIAAPGPSSRMIAVGLETQDAYGPETRRVLARVIKGLREGSPWWSIDGPTMTADSVATDQALFLSSDGKAWTILLSLQEGAEATKWYPFLRALRSSEPLLHISGEPYIGAFVKAELVREFPLLLSIASIFLFLALSIAYRSFARAARSWFVSVATATATAAFFPLLGRPLDIYTIIAPVCALAISTSYAIYASRGLEDAGGSISGLFATRGPILFLDCIATVLGFSTMLAAPVAKLRMLGAASMFGTILAFVFSLVVLPLLELKGRDKAGASSAEMDNTGIEADWKGLKGPAGKMAFSVFSILLVVLWIGCNRIDFRASPNSAILRSTTAGADAAWLEARFGVLDEIALRVDTGREYGLVDLGLYRAIGSFRKAMDKDSVFLKVYDYSDAVRSALVSLPGNSAEPTSDEEIGEALELVASSDLGPRAAALFDAGWRTASLRLRLSPGYGGRGLVSAMRRSEGLARNAGIKGDFTWSGLAVMVAGGNLAMAKAQVVSIGIYYLGVFLILLLVLRSPLTALLCALPSAAGIGAAIGLSGLSGWPLDSGSSLALAIVAGIGVNDALMFNLARSRTRLTIRSILETNLGLVAVFAALLFSAFSLIIQVYVLTAAGLMLSMGTVLLVLPFLNKHRSTKEV
jgi:predicted RND superfamily exporter protein